MAKLYSPYRSFEDMLASRFYATDEQIKTIIEKNKSVKANYILQNIQTKLDLLMAFDVSLDEVCENPNFLLMKSNDIFARCKVAHLAGLCLDSELLNCPAPTIDIINNFLAYRDNILINENDIFSTIEEASMFGDLPEEEYLAKYDNKKEKAVQSFTRVNSIFKEEFHDLYKEIGATIFASMKNEQTAKEIQSKKKRPIDPRKLELKEKIRAIYARDDSSLGNKPKTPRPALSSIEERTDVVYSAGEPVKNTPFAKFFSEHNLENTDEQPSIQETQKSKTAEKKQPTTYSRIRPTTRSVVESIPAEVKEESKNELSTQKTIVREEVSSTIVKDEPKEENKVNQEPQTTITNTYGYSESFILERQQLCEELFGLSKEDFFKKLTYSQDALTCSKEELEESRENLLEITALDQKHYASFVKCLPLPIPYYVADKVAEKIETYAEYGLTIDDIAQNFIFLRGNMDRAETKIKLAFVNHIYSDTFIRGACRNSEQSVWARMQAVKDGLTSFNRYYVDELTYNKETGLNTAELIEKYPLDENALAQIDELYSKEVASGYTWRKSYKAYIKDIQQNQPTNATSSITTKAIETNTTKALVREEPKPLSEEEIKAKELQDKKEKLMNVFGYSETEIERALEINPTLLNTDTENLAKLKNYLTEKYAITSAEFAKALRTDISLANRSLESIAEFEDFSKKFLLFTDEQIKEALTKSPQLIGKNKDEIYARACVIAKELKAPFPEVTNILIRCKRLYEDATETLSSKLKKLKTIFTTEEILANPKAVAANENSIKLRFMLNALNGQTVDEFLARNFITRETKIYARTMANKDLNLDIDVYIATNAYTSQFKNAVIDKNIATTISLSSDIDEQLMKLYPLGEEQKREIEKEYNNISPTRTLSLTDEEIEYGK